MTFTFTDATESAELAELRRRLADDALPLLTRAEVARLVELQAWVTRTPVTLPRCPSCNGPIPDHFSSCHEDEEHDPLCLFRVGGRACDCLNWGQAQDCPPSDDFRPSDDDQRGPKNGMTTNAARLRHLKSHGAVPLYRVAPNTPVMPIDDTTFDPMGRGGFDVMGRGDRGFLLGFLDGKAHVRTQAGQEGLIPLSTVVFVGITPYQEDEK